MSEPDVVVNVDYLVDQRGIVAAEQAVREGGDKANAAAQRLIATTGKLQTSTSKVATSVAKVNAGLTKAGREAFQFRQVMDGVGAAVSSIDQGLRNLQSEITKSKTLQRQAIIDQRLTADRARQADIESARAANARLNIEAQKSAQSQLISQRQSGQQRIQLTRAVLENIGRLEKGLGAVIAGTARTATGAAGRVFDTFASKVRNTNRVFTEGTSTSLSRREQLIRGSFNRQERLLSETVSRQSRTIQQLNRQVSGGVLGGVTGRGAGVGLGGIAGGAGIAGLLTSGFTRFSDLERINKQFLALTGSLEDTELLLGQVKEFAKTTPFDLVGVADLAKGFLAIGTATEDVIPRVTAIADAVALTGGGVDELNRIQRAIGQVVSAGRLQGDELNQLAENLPGLNIRQILADQLTGGNVAQLVEMQEAGEITSDLFVTGLITGLQQDERLVGASQDLAETLGGRVANLKESFADFGASLIGSIADPLKVAVLAAQTTLQGLSDFVKGNVGPGLLLLREAAKGAAIGIGSIVAAKGAVETLKLVAAASRLLLTPFGAVIATAALVGAVFNVMLKRSEALRTTLGVLRDRIVEFARGVGDKATPLIARFGDFIATRVIPALDSLASFLARNLIGALDATVRFVDEKVIPIFQRLARFVQDEVVPVLVGLGKTIGTAFTSAKTAVVDFVQGALPKLQSVAAQVREVGASISESVGNNRILAAAGAGLAGLAVGGPLVGIVAAFASLADKIIPALEPVGERIREFFKGIFTKANLLEVGKGALQIVETIGFAIGSVASDPKFLAAIGALAAAAVLVGLRFAEGVARGIASNLPDLLRAALSGISAGLSKLVSSAIFDPEVFVVALAAAFALPRLLRGFRSFGEQGAAAFSTGFSARVKSGRGFLAGLLGGVDGAQRTATKSLFSGALTELDDLQRRLRAFGSSTQVKLSPAGFAAAKTEIGDLTRGIDEATQRGLLFRDSVSRSFTTVAARGSQVAGGFRQIGTAISQSFQNVGTRVAAAGAEFLSAGTRYSAVFKRTGATSGEQFNVGFRERIKFGGSQIAEGLRSGFSELKQIAKDQGAQVGAILGSALIAGVGGFVGGRAEGAAGGSGLISILGAGISGFAIGGPIAAGVGAGAAAIGVSLGKAKKAAEDAASATSALADALKSDLADGLKAGTDGTLDFAEALDGAAQSALGAALTEQLGTVLPQLVELGLTQQDVIAAFREGGDAFDELLRKVGGARVGTQSTAGFFEVDINPFDAPKTEAIYENQAAVDAVTAAYVALTDAIALTNAETEFLSPPDVFGAIGASVLEASDKFGPFADGYRGLKELVESEPQPRFTEAMGKALEDAKINADQVSDAIDRIFGNRDPEGLAASLDAAIVGVAGQFADLKVGGDIVDQAALDIALNDLRTRLSGVTEAGIAEGSIFDEASLQATTLAVLAAALDGVEDQALRDAITAAYNDGVANALPLIDTANIYDQLAVGLSEPIPINAELDASSLIGSADTLARQGGAAGLRAGQFTADGFERGLRGRAEKVAKAAAAVAIAAKNAIDNMLGIESPSKVAMAQGGFFSEGLALGISSGAAVVSEAANQLALAATNGVAGGTASGYEFGKTIGQAIVDGLADTEGDITNVVSSAVSAALESIGSLGDPLKTATSSAAAQLFGGLSGSDRVIPGGKAGGIADAQGAVTQGLQGFLSTFDSNVSQIFEVNAKKLSDLSAAEREIFGTDVFSLDATTVFGASNVGALTSSLDSIAAFGEQLIAQGVPLDQVSAKLQAYVDDLVATATGLGFNQDQLLALVSTLGLSDEAIAAFIAEVNNLGNAAATGVPTPKPGDPAATVDPVQFKPVQNFIINLPDGDPRAAALAVANAQAAAAGLP